MFKQICPHCGEEIPPEWVQQGGLHMECYGEEIDVWFISLPHDLENGFYEKDINQVAEALSNIEEPHVVDKQKMMAGRFYNLPEFTGF